MQEKPRNIFTPVLVIVVGLVIFIVAVSSIMSCDFCIVTTKSDVSTNSVINEDRQSEIVSWREHPMLSMDVGMKIAEVECAIAVCDERGCDHGQLDQYYEQFKEYYKQLRGHDYEHWTEVIADFRIEK